MRRRSGFSLLEVSVSTVIVGFMLVAAMEAMRASIITNVKASHRGRAGALANDLLAEILGQAYREPTSTPAFGPEAGESTTSRNAFDDVDDYHNWTESPPENKSGVEMSYLAGWERSVAVHYVNPLDPTEVIGSDQGAKRVTVTIEHDGDTIATAVGIRTNTSY